MTTFDEEKDHQEYVASIITPGWDTVSDFWNPEIGWMPGQVAYPWKTKCDWLCRQEWPPTRQPEPCEVIHWFEFNKGLYRIQVGRYVPDYALPILYQDEREYIEETWDEEFDDDDMEWMLNPALTVQEYRVMEVSEKMHEDDAGKKADERRTMYRIAKVEYKTKHNYDKHYWQDGKKE